MMVRMSAPWYTTPFKRLLSGRRPVIATGTYITAGLLGLILGFVSDGGIVVRGGWLFFGTVFLTFGLMLFATLLWRRRTGG
jgi:hypothetical protein